MEEAGSTKRSKRVTVTGISRKGYACQDEQQGRFGWGKSRDANGARGRREEGRGQTLQWVKRMRYERALWRASTKYKSAEWVHAPRRRRRDTPNVRRGVTGGGACIRPLHCQKDGTSSCCRGSASVLLVFVLCTKRRDIFHASLRSQGDTIPQGNLSAYLQKLKIPVSPVYKSRREPNHPPSCP